MEKTEEEFSRMTGPEKPIGNRLKTKSTINGFFFSSFFLFNTDVRIPEQLTYILIRIGKTLLHIERYILHIYIVYTYGSRDGHKSSSE